MRSPAHWNYSLLTGCSKQERSLNYSCWPILCGRIWNTGLSGIMCTCCAKHQIHAKHASRQSKECSSIWITLSLTLTLKSVLEKINLFDPINLEQVDVLNAHTDFDPVSTHSHQVCTMAGERILFSLNDPHFDLDFSICLGSCSSCDPSLCPLHACLLMIYTILNRTSEWTQTLSQPD